MTRIKETFLLKCGTKKGNKKVEILNDGTKKFRDQNKDAIRDLRTLLTEKIDEGEFEGWFPYNNFESSVTWEVQGDWQNGDKCHAMELLAENKPEKDKTCYQCIFREEAFGSAHSHCVFDWSKNIENIPTGDPHGIKNGWWGFPWNYDPVWMESQCAEFKSKGDQ